MKLDSLSGMSPLEAALATNPLMKDISKRTYMHQWQDSDKIERQKQPTLRTQVGNGGDSYLEARPRLKKYFGGSFARAL